MPFELHTKAEYLRDVFDYIKELVPDVTLQINKHGVTIMENDKAQYGTVNVAMNKRMFSKYVVPSGQLSLRIGAAWTSKIMHMIMAEKVIITRQDDQLKFGFESDQGDSCFCTPLLSAEENPLQQVVPEMNDDICCTMPAIQWETVLANFKIFTDDLAIKFDKNNGKPRMFFECDTPGRSHIEYAFSRTASTTASTAIDVKCAYAHEDWFNLAHLQSYRGHKLASKCKIQAGEGLPLFVTFEFDKIGTDYGQLQYVLAPKVKE